MIKTKNFYDQLTFSYKESKKKHLKSWAMSPFSTNSKSITQQCDACYNNSCWVDCYVSYSRQELSLPLIPNVTLYTDPQLVYCIGQGWCES